MFHTHKTEFAEKGSFGSQLAKKSKNQHNTVALNKGEKLPNASEAIKQKIAECRPPTRLRSITILLLYLKMKLKQTLLILKMAVIIWQVNPSNGATREGNRYRKENKRKHF